MKNIGISLIFICLCGLSCSKEEKIPDPQPYIPIFEPGPMTYGWASGFKNGKEFNASGEARRSSDRPEDHFGFTFYTYGTEGELREEFSFGVISYSIYEYLISGETPKVGEPIEDGMAGGFYALFADDGDVLEDIYVANESIANMLWLTKIDTVNNIIKGFFNVKFQIDPRWPKVNPNNPDVMYFTDVKFEVSFSR